ncbi:hypothetical protein BO83DRAFT_428913 [Aspergillus eucalypticola CBS 122712]|uniref:Uncharacterized protein n=1 Tax=Aspergillus eucalypticola (strain CBS 122712 / IBT 29274) TaxID=1448314 RepID=A0A317V6C7_ASPEC|nr:uncharacterized protein BO83DRAFT_428913 [Aspergillus eucalypticola CBS 122712]PWY68801.1 hypothetical protein BO83DRAFT_428913 [Aspergillus eucalypticola CBS 122712]
MGAGFGCTAGLFVLAAILYIIVLCARKKWASPFVGPYLPKDLDEFETAMEIVRQGPEPVAAAAGGASERLVPLSSLHISCRAFHTFVSRGFLCKYTLIMMTPPLNRTPDFVYPSAGASSPRIPLKASTTFWGSANFQALAKGQSPWARTPVAGTSTGAGTGDAGAGAASGVAAGAAGAATTTTNATAATTTGRTVSGS